MSNQCRTCIHPDRFVMERLYCEGHSITTIARTHGLDEQTVRNHMKQHLSRKIAKSFEKQELSESFDLMHRLDQLWSRMEDIYTRNVKNRDTIALKALAEQRSTIDTLARAVSEYHQAKLLELEKYRKNDTTQADAEFAQKIKVLTFSELEFLERIQKKLETQDASDIIIADIDQFSMDESRPVRKRVNGVSRLRH